MKKLLIIFVTVISLGIIGFYALNTYIYNEKQGDGNGESQKDYKNIQYTIENIPVLLVDGVAETASASGSVSKTSTRFFGNEAEGDMNGDGVSDIAFLLTQETGGSGTFYYVVAALKTDVGYQGTNAVFLGDRIAPQTTQIVDGVLIVNYAERNEGEPMSAQPSVGVSKYIQFTQGRLVESQKSAPASTMGSYGYRCGDGTEFTMVPSEDMSTIHIVPATSVEHIPEATLRKMESSTGAKYEEGGITFFAQGETVTLSTSIFTTTCLPMQVPDEAPFNFGD